MIAEKRIQTILFLIEDEARTCARLYGTRRADVTADMARRDFESIAALAARYRAELSAPADPHWQRVLAASAADCPW